MSKLAPGRNLLTHRAEKEQNKNRERAGKEQEKSRKKKSRKEQGKQDEHSRERKRKNMQAMAVCGLFSSDISTVLIEMGINLKILTSARSVFIVSITHICVDYMKSVHRGIFVLFLGTSVGFL